MKIGVVMPLWIQDSPAILDQTGQAVARLHSAEHDVRVFVVCTRLGRGTPEEVGRTLSSFCRVPLQLLHEPFVERSVAGAWNWGCEHALAWGAQRIQVTANDVEVEEGTVDALAAFGEDRENASVAVWSGREASLPTLTDPVDGCDFSCFMLRRRTLEKHGSFDARFRPAYFEDNDYYARVILAGEETRVVPRAGFTHHGSLTIRLEPEAAHHVRHWFEINRTRYAEKWGVADPPGDRAGVLARCFPHPWNDPSLPLSFWDR